MVRIISAISLTGLIGFSFMRIPECSPNSKIETHLKPDFYLVVKSNLKLIDIEDLAAHANLIRKNATWYFGFHGWHASVLDSPILPNMVKAIQKSCGKCNVIQVDWKEQAEPLYGIAVHNAKEIAKYMAGVINELIKENQFGKMRVHLVGFSLGAQLAGFTAKHMYSMYKTKPARITAIEPAWPGFSEFMPSTRLDRTDADYVQVVHTAGGTLGLWTPIGHVDFYLNGGKAPQPTCQKTSITVACSHQIAKKMFAKASEKKIFGFKCSSWVDFVIGNCKADRRQQSCRLGLENKECPRGVYNVTMTWGKKS